MVRDIALLLLLSSSTRFVSENGSPAAWFWISMPSPAVAVQPSAVGRITKAPLATGIESKLVWKVVTAAAGTAAKAIGRIARVRIFMI